MEEETQKPHILDLRRLIPEEREAFRSALNAAKPHKMGLLVGITCLAFCAGMSFGVLIGTWGTVREDSAVRYGHGEYVEGDFRWNGTDCKNQK